MKHAKVSVRRWSIGLRILAATVGGYVLSGLLTLALPLLLQPVGIDEAQALLGTTMASFVVWAGIAMAVFHARTAAGAWAGIVIASALLGLMVFFLSPWAPA